MSDKSSEFLIGRFKLQSSANFDAFMAQLGVNFVARAVGRVSKPLVTLSKCDKTAFNLRQEFNFLAVSNVEFNPAKDEFVDELTADGRKVKSKFTLNKPNELTHASIDDRTGKESVCVWTFFRDAMQCKCSVDGVEAVAQYDRVS